MRFEFDFAKSAANTTKHGTDFVEAQARRLDPDRIELPARPTNEPRYLNLSKTRRPERQAQRVNVDFPVDLLRAIDREARHIGVARQAFIKLRLSDTLASR